MKYPCYLSLGSYSQFFLVSFSFFFFFIDIAEFYSRGRKKIMHFSKTVCTDPQHDNSQCSLWLIESWRLDVTPGLTSVPLASVNRCHLIRRFFPQCIWKNEAFSRRVLSMFLGKAVSTSTRDFIELMKDRNKPQLPWIQSFRHGSEKVIIIIRNLETHQYSLFLCWTFR